MMMRPFNVADGASTALALLRSASGRAFVGTAGNDSLRGTSGDDTFDLTAGGEDRVHAGGGDDQIWLGGTLSRGDRLDGGDGFDSLALEESSAKKVVFRAGQLTSIEQIGLPYGLPASVTFAAGSVVDAAKLFVFGSSGTNSISVDASAVTGTHLILEGQAGDDALIGGAADDLFNLGAGRDLLVGNGGLDRVYSYGFGAAISVDLRIAGPQQVRADLVATLTGIEGVYGTINDDTIVGDGDSNIAYGLGGKDVISLGGGDDYLIAGGSLVRGQAAVISLDGGSGADLVDFHAHHNEYAGVSVDLTVHSARDTGQGVYAIRSVEDVGGTDFDDTLTGDAGANTLYGVGGDDGLTGGGGDDLLYGDAHVEFGDLYETPAALMVVRGEVAGADILSGGSGADVLIGGAGADILSGGAGADRFVFEAVADSTPRGADRIIDFGRGDRIDLSAIDADMTLGGDQAFHLGETASHAGDILVAFDAATDATTVRLYVDADKGADMVIVLSGDHSGIAASDFAF